MMAFKEDTALVVDSSSDKTLPYYIDDADIPELPQPARQLLEDYSGIPPDQVQVHVLEIVSHISFIVRCFDCTLCTYFQPYYSVTKPKTDAVDHPTA